ncbi:MAG: shikimate kinase [Brachybacterium sp.]
MTGPVAVLIGPMAAGKTSVGRALAARLGVPFADLDALIVQETGRTIPDIFRLEGEQAFRDREAAALVRALEHQRGVLSLGGGAPMHPRAARTLQGRPVVLLEIDEPVAARRLSRGVGRPMLEGDDPMTRWRELAAARSATYRGLATHRVDAGRGSPAEVARAVIDALQLQGPRRPEEETE